MSNKQLIRKREDRMFLGVAAGLSEYLNVDPVIIRLLFVLLTLSGMHGVVIYIVLAIIMQEEGVPVAKANIFDEEEIVIKDA